LSVLPIGDTPAAHHDWTWGYFCWRSMGQLPCAAVPAVQTAADRAISRASDIGTLKILFCN